MTVGSRRRQLRWLIAAFLIGTWGCAPKAHQAPPQIPYRIPAPPSEDLRAQFGTVGVLIGGPAAEGSSETPARGKGSGAARGAGRGALYSFLGPTAVGFATNNPFGAAAGLALGIGLAPVGALVGAVYGAVSAEPAAKVEEAERTLRSALTDPRVLEAMRDRILQVARDQTPHRFVALPWRDPAGPEGPGDDPSRARVDTILEVRILEVSVRTLTAGDPLINPPLALVARACTRLLRARDGLELHALPPAWAPPLEYATRPLKKFVEWVADDARLLREHVDRAIQSLSEKIVEEVFLVHPPRGRRWTVPEVVWPAPVTCSTG